MEAHKWCLRDLYLPQFLLKDISKIPKVPEFQHIISVIWVHVWFIYASILFVLKYFLFCSNELRNFGGCKNLQIYSDNPTASFKLFIFLETWVCTRLLIASRELFVGSVRCSHAKDLPSDWIVAMCQKATFIKVPYSNQRDYIYCNIIPVPPFGTEKCVLLGFLIHINDHRADFHFTIFFGHFFILGYFEVLLKVLVWSCILYPILNMQWPSPSNSRCQSCIAGS